MVGAVCPWSSMSTVVPISRSQLRGRVQGTGVQVPEKPLAGGRGGQGPAAGRCLWAAGALHGTQTQAPAPSAAGAAAVLPAGDVPSGGQGHREEPYQGAANQVGAEALVTAEP